jgi:hypothetical protein
MDRWSAAAGVYRTDYVRVGTFIPPALEQAGFLEVIITFAERREYYILLEHAIQQRVVTRNRLFALL